MESKYIKTKRSRIHYLEGGKGQPIIMLSSLGITSKSYQHLGEELIEEYKVIIPDIGGGKSSSQKSITSLDNYVSLLNNFLKKINIDEFYLIGFSFGGLIASKYCQKHPLKAKAVLLISTTLVPIRGMSLLKAYPCLFFKNLFTKTGRKINCLWLIDGFTSFVNQPKQFLINIRIGFNNLSDAVTGLKVPHLLILANKDEFISSNKIKEMQNIKGINIEIITGNHDWFFLEPKIFLARVEKFLDKYKK